ncbi:MAG: apolipoprotein N-acyltransferase [Candidatus Hydrogenedentes bacterium]|nr:apolipoprotein N-acyltransferase [Candidatus Hydrogenedentota bacterium]
MLACLRTYGWALSSGVLMAWALPAFHWYPIAWIGLIPLLVNTHRISPRESAARFFVAGWIFHTIVLQWLIGNIFWAGGWAILGQQGICLALSGYWGLMGVLWSRTTLRLSPWFRAGSFALCWMAMEWLQARLFTGFGWASLGYSQGPDLWFSQLASLGGVLLVSGVLVGFNVLLCQAWAERDIRMRMLASALLLLAGVHGAGYALYGEAVTSSEKPFKVGLYQSNYPQQMKWDPEFQETMVDMAIRQSELLSKKHPVDLFVWPEALIMSDYRVPGVLADLEDFVAETDTPLFTGTARRDRISGAAYNASVLLDTEGAIEVYDKVKLAPFGEYIPLESYLSFARDLGASGGITAGDRARVFAVGERQFGPLICFEVLFGPLADERRQLGADFLVVVTNLGWFGQSNVLSQELEIARFRAIENRLPLVQCANTGVSGVIDPYGRITIVDSVITMRGGYVTLKDGKSNRRSAMVQRRVGAMVVPEAATLPLPGSVLWFGRLVALAGVLAAVWLVVMGPRQNDGAHR